MALAPYFRKAALGSIAMMPGVSIEDFLRIMAPLAVTLRFGEDAVESLEGRVSLELLTNLASRFYPAMSFDAVGTEAKEFAQRLTEIAIKINPVLEFPDPKPPYVVIGRITTEVSGFKAFIGSDGWNALFSTRSPQPVGLSENPVGSAVAACFASAAIFRHFFYRQLDVVEPDEEFLLSILDYSRAPCALREPLNYDLGEVALAGIGAIGNATAWLLARTQCRGRIHLIDPEVVDDSNPQRYVLTNAKSEGEEKTALAARTLVRSQLEAVAHRTTWSGFIGGRPDWKFPLAAVATDTFEDRVAVQASLPEWILNSWTQANDIGVSRHRFNLDSACLACLYWPKKQKQNLDEIVKQAIRYSGDLMDIRNMLYFGSSLDHAWLDRISKDMGQPREFLEQFKGKTLEAFYREAICGGHVIATENGKIEVPMAFQSAMAGIMLAGELVKFGKEGRTLNTDAVTTKLDLLRPLGTHLSEAYRKRSDIPCICSDNYYQKRYAEKYLQPVRPR